MQRNWQNLNVNLSNLVKNIIQFFESKEFNDVTALKTEKGYQIIVGDSKQYKMENDVSVTIEGSPDDFTVSLASCKQEKRSPIPLFLMSMFGGGYFALKGFRSEEAMQKLERDFRQKIEGMVAQAQGPR